MHSLQFIRRGFNEEWDLVMKYQQLPWEKFKICALTFDEYIEKTYQIDYFGIFAAEPGTQADRAQSGKEHLKDLGEGAER